MLSAFPQLFNYSLLATAGLRIFFGIWFVVYAYHILFGKETQDTAIVPPIFRKIVAGASLAIGFFAIIGLFTQIAVLGGIFILFLKWYFDIRANTLTRTVFMLGLYIAIIGLALLFMGPGIPAVDLPL